MRELDTYFTKCIKDACKAEGLEYNDKDYGFYYIVVDNQILFKIKALSSKVFARTCYRIENNINKIFGFNINGDYFLSTFIQPNFSHNKLNVCGKDLYLCKAEQEAGEVIQAGRYEKLVKKYFNIELDEVDKYDLPDLSWQEFRELYKGIYNKYPELKIQEHSDNIETGENE